MRSVSDDQSKEEEITGWHLTILRIMKRTLFFFIGYPYFDKDELEGRPEVLEGVPSAELKECMELSIKRPCCLFSTVIFTIYFIKNNFVVISSFLAFDHYDPSRSLEEITYSSAGGGQYKPRYRFGCIETNCTRLTNDSSLAQDLSFIPLITVCEPRLNIFYAPSAYLDSFGLLLLTTVSFQVFVLGAGVAIMQYYFPLSCESLMFILAPTLIVNKIRNRLKILFVTLDKSFKNFKSIAADRRLDGGLCAHHSRDRFRSFRYQIERPSIYHTDSDLENEELVEDCIPVIRSNWWRAKLVRLFMHSIVAIYSTVTAIASILFIYIYIMLMKKRAFLKEVADSMAEQNCFIWHPSSSQDRSIEYINLDPAGAKWTLYSLVETSVIVSPPLIMMSATLVSFYVTTCELACWLEEVKLQIQLAIETGRLQGAMLREPNNIKPSRAEVTTKFDLNMIRRKFKENTYLNSISRVTTKPMERRSIANAPNKAVVRTLDAKMAQQEFVLDSLATSRWNAQESYAEMIKKVYISFRLIVDLVSCYSPHVVNSVIVSLIMNYGFAIIALWYSRQIRNFNLEPITLVLCAWIFSAILILLAAKFHANARKLHPLLWTLVTQLTDSQDIKIQHIRLLLEKQIRTLDSDGGIALKSRWLRITYINIIQLCIWTATIIVLTP